MIGGWNISGGGSNINGIIEQYKVEAGENISAGDFVSYVSGNFSQNKISENIITTDIVNYGFAITQIDDDKVLYMSAYISKYFEYYLIKFTETDMICTHVGSTYAGSTGNINFTLLTLNKNRVLVTYVNNSETTKMQVIDIGETAISEYTSVQITGGYVANIYTTKIAENKCLFMVYTSTLNAYRFYIINISDSGVITSETCHNDPTWIYFSKYEYIRLFNIEDNKVLLFYYKTNNQPMMRVVNVGTNDVTYKTEIEFTPRCTKWY